MCRTAFRPLLSLLLLFFCAACTERAAAAATATTRLPLELTSALVVKRAAFEPPFTPGAAFSAVLGRGGQFSLHIPP